MKKQMLSLAAGAAAVCGWAADPGGDNWGWKITDLGEAQNEVAFVFTNTAEAINWTIPEGVSEVRYLVVGGGGGGGYAYGGGGGAGGFKEGTQSVGCGEAVLISVGAGGAGASAALASGGCAVKGAPSSLKIGDELVAEAAGGGYGGSWSAAGGGGACGGGAGMGSGGATMPGGTGSEGGNGASGGNEIGGGGGGFTADGSDIAGGAGQSSDITGASVRYAGGGGGGVKSNKGAGGLGKDGGGNGGGTFGGAYTIAQPGVDGLGGGGGGGGVNSTDAEKIGAKGGDGVVILRFVDPTAKQANEFVEPPSVAPSTWAQDAKPKTLNINYGLAKSGTAGECSHTVAEILALPVGRHEITFTAPETDTYKAYATNVYVTVGYPATVGAVEITFPGYEGTETLVDFPALVRISPDTIAGLDAQKLDADGKDLRFLDADGNELAHEIDTWDPNGESLVWVKVPELTKETMITMHWGQTRKFGPRQTTGTDVWSDYDGVWHFNEQSGTTFADATKTEGGLDASVVEGVESEISAQVVGTGVTLTNAPENAKTVLLRTGAQKISGQATFSGWYRLIQTRAGTDTYPSLIDCGNYNKGGFYLQCATAANQGEALAFVLDGGLGNCGNTDQLKGQMHHVTISFKSGAQGVYIDGQRVLNQSWPSFKAWNDVLALVGDVRSAAADEIRLRPTAMSADWAKAEYQVQKKGTTFTEYKFVQNPVAAGFMLILR